MTSKFPILRSRFLEVCSGYSGLSLAKSYIQCFPDSSSLNAYAVVVSQRIELRDWILIGREGRKREFENWKVKGFNNGSSGGQRRADIREALRISHFTFDPGLFEVLVSAIQQNFQVQLLNLRFNFVLLV